MAGLGVGLGALASGFERGYGLGQKMKADRRADEKQGAIDAINKKARSDFDTQVAAGTQKPEDFDAFYSRYYVPKIATQLAQQGDLEGAAKWKEWASSDSAREGSRLFGSGLLKAQLGDSKGALGDFVAAGRVQGYGGDYKIGDPVETKGGLKVPITGPDGKDYTRTFKSPDEIAQFGASYLNPKSAYDDYRAGAAAADKMRTSIAEDAAKLGNKRNDDVIRRNMGLTGGQSAKDEAQARLNLRKQAFDEIKDSDAFYNATPAEQEQMLQERIGQITGQGTGAAPRTPQVIIDSVTGQVVDPNSVAAPKGDRLPIRRPATVGLGTP